MSQAQNIALEVAENAVEFLQYGNQQLQWLAAEMKAIELDAKHNHGRTSTDPVSFGHYLSSDDANLLGQPNLRAGNTAQCG